MIKNKLHSHSILRTVLSLSIILAFELTGCSTAGKQTNTISIDPDGPFVFLVSERANHSYAEAIEQARQLHIDAVILRFRPDKLQAIRTELVRLQPRYAMVFMEPAELDANFAWQLLTLSTQIDDDPFVDLRYGFITGVTPASAAALIQRTKEAAAGKVQAGTRFVDDQGPVSEGPRDAFYGRNSSMFLPVFALAYQVYSFNHGLSGFPTAQLESSFHDAGIVHFGGHGHPDGIDDGLKAKQLAALPLSPASVVFSGACYTGVVDRWFETWTKDGQIAEQNCLPETSFCLNLLNNPVIAYFGSLHPDHGIPVYQELEYLAYTGNTMGDVIKHTYDGVVMANCGKLPVLPKLRGGESCPQWSPSQVMLLGSASRVLFGDPSLKIGRAFAKPPLRVLLQPSGKLEAAPENLDMKSSFTDTYFADLATDPNMFNDRAFIRHKLPANTRQVAVKSLSAHVGTRELKTKLRGAAIEKDNGQNWIVLQVDLPATGYMQSPWRERQAQLNVHLDFDPPASSHIPSRNESP